MAFLPPGPNRRMTRSERWTIAVFGVILFGLFGVDVALNYSPVKLSILFFIVSWFPLLVIHESGHALMAAMLNWRVRRVVIGFGKSLKNFSVRRVPVELRMIPLEGFTQIAPKNTRLPRLKSFLIYSAGPAAEFVFLLLLVGLIGLDELVSRTEHVGMIAAQSIAIAILMGLVSNLVPHSTETQSGRSPNDGLGMILSLSLTESQVDEMVDLADKTKPGQLDPNKSV
jgi:peptidase M50-like protein